ncbi:hypothetical protein LLH00_11685 [bacterium]|nr:hypothetical protein [bacterium]
MTLIQAILAVARFEAKILWRSWFFRIFALLFMILIGLFDFFMFCFERSARWMFYGMAGGIPYADLLFLNILQAVVAIFLASDFLKFDRKLDTTDVIYMRSMTNASYVLGKVLGVLAVFMLLNGAVLAEAAVFNLFFAEAPFIWQAYVFYPLIISLPTLVFIFGLTFLLMILVRSQALVFVLLLGYIAAVMFFLQDNAFRLFDYTAFNLPLAWSDFTGLGDISLVLMQRGFYLLSGLALVLVTALLLRRLPQTRIVSILCAAGAALCVAGALSLALAYVNNFRSGSLLRSRMLAMNDKYASQPRVCVTGDRLELEHRGTGLSASAALSLTNRNDSPLDQYRLSLNPGFTVKSVTRNGADIPFERELHLLLIHPSQALAPGAVDSLRIAYEGAPDQQACYLDIPDSVRYSPNRPVFFCLGKAYAFVQPDYLLLTPEDGWYPTSGLPAGPGLPTDDYQDFTAFSLSLTTAAGLNATAPGARDSLGGGKYRFSPEEPLPRFNVTAGRYDCLSISTDSLSYSIFILRGHDFFSSQFKELGAKLPEELKKFKNDLENKLGLDYPFPRFTLVETPLQFCDYNRPWLSANESIQPEQALLPEKGLLMEGMDFRSMNYWRSQSMSRRGQSESPEDAARNSLNMILSSNFGGGNQRGMFMRAFRRSSGGNISLQRLAMSVFGSGSETQTFNQFPQFYGFPGRLSSKDHVVFNLAFEQYLLSLLNTDTNPFRRMMLGISVEEEANLLLAKQSLSEVLADPEDAVLRLGVLSSKSQILFGLVEARLGQKPFQEFLHSQLNKFRHQVLPTAVLLDSLKARFEIDLDSRMDAWLNSKSMPAFLFAGSDCREVLQDNQTRYQLSFKVQNTGDGEGLIQVDASRPRGGPGFRPGPDNSSSEEKHLYAIPAGAARKISLLVDEAPGNMRVNTFVSLNIPAEVNLHLGEPVEDHKAAPFEGVEEIQGPLSLEEPGTIVVDNEDPGFKIEQRASEGRLKKLFSRNGQKTKDEYAGIWFWNPPAQWTATANSDFYGLYRHSASYIKAGSGDNKVSWTAKLPKSGQYDVFVYITVFDVPWMRRGPGGAGNFVLVDDFHFSVHHDDGTEEVEIDASAENTGWVLLKDWYFSQGDAVVELSDQSKGRIVYADAVKWVEHK